MSSHPTGPQQVVIQPPPSNGLGVAGFVCSIFGLLTCGVLALISLPLSFFALFKRPRGLAIAGFIISLVALIPPALVVLVIGGGTVLAAIGLASFANQIQAEIAAEQIYAHYQSQGQLPAQADADAMLATQTQFTQHAPRYAATGATTFELTLPGKDGAWGTADDFAETYDVTQMGSSSSP